jgi:hypothetical protein
LTKKAQHSDMEDTSSSAPRGPPNLEDHDLKGADKLLERNGQEIDSR